MAVRSNPLEHGRYWDGTLNAVASCEIVPGDPSCVNCYAVTYAAGIHKANDVKLYRDTTISKQGRDTWNKGRRTVLPLDHRNYTEPLRWKGVRKPLLGPGKRSILWVDSMADIFDPRRLTDTKTMEAIDYYLKNVAISRHIGLVLTKHPAQMVEYFSTKPAWWHREFILVISAGDQRWFDVRWRIMRILAEQGWIIGTSIQPMLGQVVLPPDFLRLAKWVICGGEQHPGHREANPDWMRSLRDQCKEANPPLPFFVKQMTSGWIPPDLLFREFPQV